jgi:hypothetical protein
VRHTSGQFGAGLRDAVCRTLKYVTDVRFETCYRFLLWHPYNTLAPTESERDERKDFLQSRLKNEEAAGRYE